MSSRLLAAVVAGIAGAAGFAAGRLSAGPQPCPALRACCDLIRSRPSQEEDAAEAVSGPAGPSPAAGRGDAAEAGSPAADPTPSDDERLARLRARVDAEQQFTSDLAHELRTPLTGLVNAANLLEEDSRPAELVRERVARLQVLVEDLLEVSRLGAGRAEPALAPVGLDAAVKSALGSLSASGALAGRDLDVDCGAPGVVVETDQRRFERIIANLVINSIRHGADPIEVHTTPTTVTVADRGPGYPADILAHGPSRFRSAGGGGMGLGLVIADGQATLLGMELEFADRPGGGAMTTVRISGGEAQSSA